MVTTDLAHLPISWNFTLTKTKLPRQHTWFVSHNNKEGVLYGDNGHFDDADGMRHIITIKNNTTYGFMHEEHTLINTHTHRDIFPCFAGTFHRLTACLHQICFSRVLSSHIRHNRNTLVIINAAVCPSSIYTHISAL